MTGPRSGTDLAGNEYDDLASDYRKASEYDPYHAKRLEERRDAKLSRTKDKLRKASGKRPSRAKAQREPVTSIAKVESDRSRKNSRTKGNRGELDVAEVFSKWSGEIIRRTPGSGGWGGSKDFGTTADLVCKKKAFPFHIEVKHREGWVLDDLVTGARKEHDKSILQWWIQCTNSCPSGKMPVLVFRRNRQPWLVMTHAVLATPVDGVITLWLSTGLGPRKVSVMLLSAFLDNVSVPCGLNNHGKR